MEQVIQDKEIALKLYENKLKTTNMNNQNNSGVKNKIDTFNYNGNKFELKHKSKVDK